jgi:hypothetical protein
VSDGKRGGTEIAEGNVAERKTGDAKVIASEGFAAVGFTAYGFYSGAADAIEVTTLPFVGARETVKGAMVEEEGNVRHTRVFLWYCWSRGEVVGRCVDWYYGRVRGPSRCGIGSHLVWYLGHSGEEFLVFVFR